MLNVRKNETPAGGGILVDTKDAEFVTGVIIGLQR